MGGNFSSGPADRNVSSSSNGSSLSPNQPNCQCIFRHALRLLNISRVVQRNTDVLLPTECRSPGDKHGVALQQLESSYLLTYLHVFIADRSYEYSMEAITGWHPNAHFSIASVELADKNCP